MEDSEDNDRFLVQSPLMANILLFHCALTCLAGISGLVYIRKKRLRGAAKSTLQFFLLPSLGFAAAQLKYSMSISPSHFTTIKPFLGYVIMTSLYWVGFPLRYLPLTILYLRILVVYRGHPSLFSWTWVPFQAVRSSRLNLAWMAQLLLCFLSPGLALMLWELVAAYGPNGDPRHPWGKTRYTIMVSFDFIYLAISLAAAGRLYLIRHELRIFDLDQSKLLGLFFGCFLLQYIFTFTLDHLIRFGNTVVSDDMSVIIMITICIWIIVLWYITVILWFLNIRLVLARHKNGVMHLDGTPAPSNHTQMPRPSIPVLQVAQKEKANDLPLASLSFISQPSVLGHPGPSQP